MNEPVLSMLWERTDPAVALRERFGLSDVPAATTFLTALLGEDWGLEVTAYGRVVVSAQNLLAWVRTQHGRFVVKACGQPALFDRLGVIAEVVARLGAQDLPVAAPRRTLTGAARVLTPAPTALSVVVLPEAAGDLVDAGDPPAVRATGATLARVHLALARIDVALPPPTSPVPDLRADRGRLLAQAVGSRDRAPRAAARLEALLAELPDLDVAPGLVHGDVRGANVLVDAGRVTALLDHDNLRVGHRVHDLAAGAVKLATRFHTWDPPPPGAREHLVDGYRTVAPLTPVEEGWLEATVLAEGLGQIPWSPDPSAWTAAVERGI